jgi:hypothetical protein
MRSVKVRAAQTDRKLKDVIAELITRGLAQPPSLTAGPAQELRSRLIFNADGTVTNPNGIEDPEFFDTLERIREESRRKPPHDPFAEH